MAFLLAHPSEYILLNIEPDYENRDNLTQQDLDDNILDILGENASILYKQTADHLVTGTTLVRMVRGKLVTNIRGPTWLNSKTSEDLADSVRSWVARNVENYDMYAGLNSAYGFQLIITPSEEIITYSVAMLLIPIMIVAATCVATLFVGTAFWRKTALRISLIVTMLLASIVMMTLHFTTRHSLEYFNRAIHLDTYTPYFHRWITKDARSRHVIFDFVRAQDLQTIILMN